MVAPYQLASKALAVEPFYVMDILARAKQLEQDGADVLHLEIGEPDFSAPPAVVAAACASLQAGQSHYSAALGLPQLRQAIADFYRQRYQLQLDARQIGVTAGASAALSLLLAALVDSGDKVLISDPSYPCNRHFVRIYGAQAVNIKVDASSNYQLTCELIAANLDARSKLVMLASPANPTGTRLARAELAAIAQLCKERQIWLLVDEIYSGIEYVADLYSGAEFDNVIVINSFSKYFALTGLRVGWFVIPKMHAALAQTVDKLAQNFYLCPPITAQYAALAALQPAALQIYAQRVVEFKARRDFLLPRLQQLGFGIAQQPEGAFYIYANCSKFLNAQIADSSALCEFLLERAHVAITPGKDFGVNGAAEHVRFAYTRPIAVLEQALARLRRVLN